MQTTFDSWRGRAAMLVLFAILAGILLIPLASNTSIPNVVDYVNHISGIIQAKMAFGEGQFPLRITPADHAGWRYPFFQFYSPTTYTLSGLIYRWLTPTNPFLAYKITTFLALIVGGIYMYRLAYDIVKSKDAAILASVVYLTTPYFALLIDHLGAFNETIALAILPGVLYYTLQRYYHSKDYKTLLQTALVWYLLATIHLLTFIITSLLVAIFLLILTFKNRHYWNLIEVGIAYTFGCLLAIWYLAPIILFSKYLIINHTFNLSTYFHNHTPSLASLLSPVANASKNIVEPNGIIDIIAKAHPSIGFPILLGVGICLYTIIKKWRAGNARTQSYLPPLLTLFFLTFALTWAPINIWKWLPPSFMVIQYSWRFLGQLTWIGALLFAFAMKWLFTKTLHPKILLLCIIAITLCSVSWITLPEIKVNNFINKEFPITTTDVYLLDTKKFPWFIQHIDNIVLAGSGYNSQLELSQLKSLSIPPQSLIFTAKPFLSIQGHTAPLMNTKNQQAQILVNGKVISSFLLTPGVFTWHVPLAAIKVAKPSKINIQFKTNSQLVITIDEILLRGFRDPAKTLDINQIAPLCHQQGEETICNIKVPPNISLLELPLFYYPELLNVTLNGKNITYSSVYYKNNVITAITPEPGRVNKITMQFRGLMWANYLSSVAWQIWGIFFVFLLLRAIFYNKKNEKSENLIS
jgi:hypothetical protein